MPQNARVVKIRQQLLQPLHHVRLHEMACVQHSKVTRLHCPLQENGHLDTLLLQQLEFEQNLRSVHRVPCRIAHEVVEPAARSAQRLVNI